MQWWLVGLGALGYLTDIFDLFLFNVLRTPSLAELGLSPEAILSQGVTILNCQMAGLVLGSVAWGILGDRLGRVKILYGSILLYSLVTLLNGFVQTVPQYAACRFFAGLGLAGELGGAVTLVMESLTPKRRGIGTTFIAGLGLFGGVLAGLVANHFHWRTCYWIGGGAGLFLLALRIQLKESAIYVASARDPLRGRIILLVASRERFLRFTRLFLVGVPVYYISGILIVFAPELGRELELTGPVSAADAVMYSYLGAVSGDFLGGFLSQVWQARRKVIALCLLGVIGGIEGYVRMRGADPQLFLLGCFILGVTSGYWVVLLTSAAETFGTNLRATVTTVIPNLVRASVIPMTLIFRSSVGKGALLISAEVIGLTVVLFALLALPGLPETFGRPLDFRED